MPATEKVSEPPSVAPSSTAFTLPLSLLLSLKEVLPLVASHAVAAIVREVPAYAEDRTYMESNIETAVQVALGGFLTVASRTPDDTRPRPMARDTAYDLGRGEARNGRSVEALLSAFRIGARVSWEELSSVLVKGGVEAGLLARFAALVFAYIDDLSAASVAGHSDELASADRVLERHLERLTLELLRGATTETLARRVERARWTPPADLTVVLVPEAEYRATRTALDSRSLLLVEDLPDAAEDEAAAFLVPDAASPGARRRLVRSLEGHLAVVGPARPWARVSASYERALRGWRLQRTDGSRSSAAYDTDDNLAAMVLTADPEALADLRTRALAPMAELTPAAQAKLEQTLRLWLLNQGRREAIAEGLFVHPQTVRYRMGQLRELYGDALDDPAVLLDLTIALGVERT